MFVKNLIRLRKASKLNQQDLADKMAVSRNSITNWETGKSEPKASDIQKMAEVLGVSPNDFFDDFSSRQEQAQNIADIAADINDSDVQNFAFWGSVVDKAVQLAQTGNEQIIKLIAPLLKRAYETLMQQNRELQQKAVVAKTNAVIQEINDNSVYGGHHNNNGIKFEFKSNAI